MPQEIFLLAHPHLQEQSSLTMSVVSAAKCLHPSSPAPVPLLPFSPVSYSAPFLSLEPEPPGPGPRIQDRRPRLERFSALRTEADVLVLTDLLW